VRGGVAGVGIGADLNDDVAETNEVNNNVDGVFGPQVF